MTARNGSADWHGDVKTGSGTITVGDGVFSGPYSYDSRFGECLGFNETIDPNVVRDLVIVGAGPAGRAAAMYGASEGLKVLVIEADVLSEPEM
jgi:NADPH-dependent 2,4-dienoyl-CoA reductase/sulfur reductase-like enzyme